MAANPIADTIVAVATPPGEGGIGIVRVSGPDAVGVCDRLFRARRGASLSTTAPFRLRLGDVIDPGSGEVLDEGMAVRMPEGRSYTMEAVVELHLHGSRALLERVVEAAVRCGARPALPGEFTRRAFLNGRIDLTQAESVAELIHSGSEASRRAALARMGGGVTRAVVPLRERLLDILAGLEASLDLSEDEELSVPLDLQELSGIGTECARLAESGAAWRRGEGIARVVIAGLVNAGKSSLFNVLSGYSRAIVTPIPGTTRDSIEERITLDGISFTLVDTAGQGSPADEAEAEGMRRAKELCEAADCLVLVIDGSRPLRREEFPVLEDFARFDPLIVIAKRDLPASFSWAGPAVEISSVTGEGIDRLKSIIAGRLAPDLRAFAEAASAPPNARQIEMLSLAAEAIARAVDHLASHSTEDMAAAEVREAADRLGALTGHLVDEMLLDRIFSRFCVGK